MPRSATRRTLLGRQSVVTAYPGDLSQWRTKRIGNYHVAVFSDSIGAGVNANAPASTNGWAWQLLAWAKSTYGDGGTFLGTWFDLVDIDERTLWTKSGSWTDYSSTSPHGALYFQSPYTAGTAVITANGPTIDLYNLTYAGTAAYTVTVDSDAPVTIGGTSGGAYIKETLTTTAGAHTLTFTNPATENKEARLFGISARTGNGLITLNSSKSGLALPISAALPFMAVLPTALCIISLTTNNYTGQTALATYETALRDNITAIGATSSILLVSEGPNGAVGSYPIPQSSYDALVLRAAKTYGCGYINFNALWGGSFETAYALGYMDADDKIHPNQNGHDHMFQTMRDFLTP